MKYDGKHPSLCKPYSKRRRSFAFKRHWIGRNASEKSLRRYCEEIWSDLIRERDGHRCVICGSTKAVQAHHLISRQWLPTAFLMMGGVTLCKLHHTTKSMFGTHSSPWILEDFLRKNNLEQYEWWLRNRKVLNTHPKRIPKIDFKKTLADLIEIHRSMIPIQHSHYYEFTPDQERAIADEYRSTDIGMSTLGKKWKTTQIVIRRILKKLGIPSKPCGRRSGRSWSETERINHELYHARKKR